MIDINLDNVLKTIDTLNGEETSAILVRLQRNRQEFRRLDWDNKDRLKAAMAALRPPLLAQQQTKNGEIEK